MLDKIIIAIDGPSGSGKSTVAKELSKIYDIHYLDTGAMYRAVALKTIREQIDLSDRFQVREMLLQLQMKIQFEEGVQRTIIGGEDVTALIRSEEVSQKASDVATIPEIRLKLVEIQRSFGNRNGCIMDGRDIGTYVFPDADIKFYLIASVEERAKRRYTEHLHAGKYEELEEIQNMIIKRDQQDTNRTFAPLRKAEDALEIDTSKLTIELVLEQMCKILNPYLQN